jgi:thymidylate kinase
MVKLLLSKEERAIVDILNPEKNEGKLPDSLPVDFIINNRVCYSLYGKMGENFESNFDPEELEPIYRKAKFVAASINELQSIDKALEENDINFVFLFKAISSQCDSTDIDIYLEDKQVETAGKVMEHLGYFAPLFPFEKYDFVKSEESNKVVQIDLLFEREGNICHYIFGEGKIRRLLNNKRKINGLYLPSPEDELMIGILRTIEKKQIPLCTILYISHLLENCQDIDYIRSCIKKGWYIPLLHSIYLVNILYKSFFDREIESPLIPVAERVHEESKILRFLAKIETKKLKIPFYSKTFLSFWYTCKLLSNIRNFDFREIAKSIYEPFRVTAYRSRLLSTARKRRMLICFSGIDGTGKTTNTTKLVRRFKDMRIPSQYASGLWSPKISYPLMGVLFVLKGWRKKDYKKSKIMKKMWNYIVILDYIYIYITRMWCPRLLGKTLFCDKYTYDLIAMLMHDGLYNEKASKILLKLIPQPDLIFMLDIPESVSDSRKDDTQAGLEKLRVEQDMMEYLKIKRESYINIAKSLDIPIIDATKNWDELHEEIFNKIIEAYKNKQMFI